MAAVSLLLGDVGIMDIALASLTERTREMGALHAPDKALRVLNATAPVAS